MFRFTIRDVLWLTVVVALVLWSFRERSALKLRAAKLESDGAALQEQRADLENERTVFMTTINRIRDNAFDDGFRRGADSRRIVPVPLSQKEAKPGVFFLGPEIAPIREYRRGP